MRDRRCRYCQQLFAPSRYLPQQAVCGRPDCQRRRRRDYHRHKIASDPVYRQVCLESSGKWRTQHPGYWKQYRQAHPASAQRNRQQQQPRDQRQRLRHLANNNLALDLKRSAAEVWLLGPKARDLANNTLARSQVLILEGVIHRGAPALAPCQQHPSGFSLNPPL